MEKNKYLGLCYFGQQIVKLVDLGETERNEVVIQKASESKLVEYLLHKYDVNFPADNYDINAFEEFFSEYLLETRFENGLSNMVYTILDKAELSTPKWSE